ncbi:dipeptidyl aminopeptidase/acylaminoacyl peptidase [Winogradskyella epiphytica]|uniref:Dipeptidyl aminopeptidase/acylaminoacyl peptidase n=1 Tax=Winogradskyella epiphytica TaxID=262005 RepID=A0A2V4YC11_9FLAO|nr:DPP IV N-terminal domain-containing protein [Winogradskyella epiphytica]PYE80677.1 dipeptidyl aminopeptidase/acylaminoacyl peptidase [Winogradskyella epiphytica]GGW67661.1 X-Pro dipeptidyl-peptidase [Winogradskyella epiphytica]
MKNLLFLLIFGLTFNFSFSQDDSKKSTPTPNYRAAAKYSPTNLAKLVHSTSVRPHWLKNGNRFWYQYKTTDGSKYYIVDADNRTKKELFDNEKMAKWLTEITKDPYDAQHLPKFDFEFVKNETAIRFYVTSTEKVDEENDEEDNVDGENIKENDSIKTDTKKKKKAKKVNKVYHFEYRLGSNGLTVIDNKKKGKEKWKKWANIAPDSSVVLFSKNYNLYWMDKENFLKAVKNEKDTTIVENKWTEDGELYYSYGGSSGRGETNETMKKNKDKRQSVRGIWSHDSKKFVFQRTDSRHIDELWVINTTSGKRPTLETYKYHMPGEDEYYKTELHVFDIPSKTNIQVQLDTVKQQSIQVYRAPRKKSTYDDDFSPSLLLSKQGKIYFNTISRDRKKLDICVADINTGEVKVLIEERFNTYIESRPLVLFNNETEMLHWAERSGWAHYYLYDTEGNLKNQVTSGSYHVEEAIGVDEKTRTLYFTAHGVNKDIDPYYEQLHKINLNGSGLKTLNPGDYNTSTSMADSNSYFVSNYSRVNTVPKSELRSSTGKLVMDLEEADLSQLMATGYKFPEPFKMKADDGITDIYGVMYKPFDFDENKSYPLLEYVYPGPQTEAVNKSFSVRMDRLDRMAQVGFIVVTMGNRGGHPDRSKWYHNYGYGNLRDYGLADKRHVAEQLADQYDFIDIEKVGIYGHSGGGFMSTAAMLVYPDFFKAAVSSAGNHDNNIYNSWWSETHHGVEEEMDDDGNVKYKYMIDTNQALANNLKGNLMLITGDVDNNVHPGGTIRMANALIKANKRFDFMLMPGQRHSFGNMTEYSFWLRADHFSKHLLGVEATEVDITEINRDQPKTK